MGEVVEGGKVKQMTNIIWFVFIVWFCSNLLSTTSLHYRLWITI